MMVPTKLADGSRMNVGFGGLLVQSVRMAAQTFKFWNEPPPEDTGVENNPFLRFMRGHSAFWPGFITEVALGRDYMRNRTTVREAFARRFIPFWIQSVFPKGEQPTHWQRASDASFNFIGLRSFPESEYAQERRKIDELSQQRSGKAFSDLSLPQRANVIKQYQQSPEWKKRRPTIRDRERFIAINEQRTQRLQTSLGAEARKKLDNLGLELPGYRATFEINKQSVPLTDEEQARYEAILLEEYNRKIASLSEANLKQLPSWRREEIWKNVASSVGKRSRARLQTEINKKLKQ